MPDNQVTVYLQQQKNYQLTVRFNDNMAPLLVDEPAPLGQAAGPSPVQLLCSAVGSCLSDSLLFAFTKFKQDPAPISCTVIADIGRNEASRLRVLAINARLRLGVPAASLGQLERVIGQFESFCTVTQSVGQGIPITVEVVDSDGVRLK